MKNLIKISVIFLFFNNSMLAQENIETFPLDAMIGIINNSLEKANQELENKGNVPEINTAKINLKTSYSKSGGGGFKLFVKASKTWQLEKANSITFTYEKVNKTREKSIELFDQTPFFERNLKNAIVDASLQWFETSNTVEGLTKKNFTVDISFILTKTLTGGIEFEIWGAGIDLSADYEKSAVHSVSLTFK